MYENPYISHMNNTTTATAQAVEKAREGAGLSRNALAEASGIPYATLYRKLNARASFTVEDLDHIAVALGVDPRSLVDFGAVAS